MLTPKQLDEHIYSVAQTHLGEFLEENDRGLYPDNV